MTFTIKNGSVFWKNTRIKADAVDFHVLHTSLARAGDTIYMGAKPVAVDGASFEVLSAGYARDAKQAFEILETKLKPVKGADAASFEALSATYARDAAWGYFRGKRIARCEPASLAPLHEVFAADAERMYFTNQRLDGKLPPLDRSKAKIFAAINEVNCPAAILVDDKNVYTRSFNAKGWLQATKADPASFRFLGEAGLDGDWQIDLHRVYFRGQAVDGAHPASSALFGNNLLRDGPRLWSGLHRLDEPVAIKAQGEVKQHRFGLDLVHCSLNGDVYRDAAGVWQIQPASRPDGAGPPHIALLATSAVAGLNADQALEKAYRHVFALLGAVFRKLPFHVDYRDLPDPVADVPGLGLRRRDSSVEVLCDGEVVSSGPVSMWMGHASSFWARRHGRRDRLYIYPDPNWLPTGDELHLAVAKAAAEPLIDLAAALLAAGQTLEAEQIAHLVLYRALNKKAPPTLLARTPLALAGEGNHLDLRHRIEATTHLAGAREVLRLGWLASADFRVRYDMLRLLHGFMNDTSQREVFYQEIVPEVIRRQAVEPAGLLQEMAAAIVEMALISAYVDTEVNHAHHYCAVEPFIRHQIAAGVNVDWNRARLIEALWAMQRHEEAEALRLTLLVDCPDDWIAPPRYRHREHWRNHRLQLMHGRILAAFPQPKETGSERESPEALATEIEALRAHFGHPADWPEFQALDDTLQQLLSVAPAR